MLAPDTQLLREQIASLREQFPDVWDSRDAQYIEDMLEGSTDLHKVVGLLAKRAIIAEHDAKSSRELMHELKVRVAQLVAGAEALRDAAQKWMTDAGLKKMTVPGANLAIVPGPPKVIITDMMLLPKDCLRTYDPEPDKITIGQRLKDGIDVPGASLSNAEDSLRITVAKPK